MGSKIDDFKLGDNTSLNPEEKQRLLDLILDAKPEKKIPYWRSHKGDEIDHARAIGNDEALDEYEAKILELFGGDE